MLTRGFGPARSRQFWVNALARLAEHPALPGLPRHGYMLESGQVPVGVILLIFTAIDDGGGPRIQCNVSSWYVEPEFRMFGTMLISHALKHKHVTYFNVTPAPHTLAILQAQSYRQFCRGRVVAAPAMSLGGRGVRVEAVAAGVAAARNLPEFEASLLQSHAGYGCISLICHVGGESYPFVFAPRRKFGVVAFAFLIYCRALDSFVRFSGPLGRFLLRHGLPLVILDANGPVRGLVGRYYNANPKYFRGPRQPRLGDLSYSERAMFGV